jgi:hypothetical protein
MNDVEMAAALADAHWKEIRESVWQAPWGALYVGPAGAYRAMTDAAKKHGDASVPTKIDTGNYQMVGGNGEMVVVMRPRQTMTKSEANLHAAWLVTVAGDDDEFKAVLQAVRNT